MRNWGEGGRLPAQRGPALPAAQSGSSRQDREAANARPPPVRRANSYAALPSCVPGGLPLALTPPKNRGVRPRPLLHTQLCGDAGQGSSASQHLLGCDRREQIGPGGRVSVGAAPHGGMGRGSLCPPGPRWGSNSPCLACLWVSVCAGQEARSGQRDWLPAQSPPSRGLPHPSCPFGEPHTPCGGEALQEDTWQIFFSVITPFSTQMPPTTATGHQRKHRPTKLFPHVPLLRKVRMRVLTGAWGPWHVL